MDNVKEPASPFGRRLREFRKAKFLNQKQLADMVGLDFTYLSKIETGTMPPPTVETIRKLAEALHVPPDELILLAGKFPEDLRAVAGKTIMPDLLRAIKDSKISDEQLKALVELLKSCKPEQK